MIGRAISQYQILEKLGEGGMGVVYKAEDTKLKRTVALKFLSAELIRDPQAKKRFLQEAQAAAALDHPNICTIHEINEAEGQTYIAMAYVEGKSLKEKLEAGPLAISDALDITIQVAEGLKRAHGKGIIHRDIKPANIMLTEEGRAKIMDFGLAKLTTGPDVTKTLTVMGTFAYMSPEQARGESVDHRTDIWSFGAMLYEMLTGQTPFGRKQGEAAPDSILPDTPALLHSILYDPVEPPSRFRKDLPRPVEGIILKALDKDKSRRYQNMEEVLKDLKTARSPELIFPKPEKSIVILPFENISPDPDQEYFCDGMTEEIIADLSKIHSLRVISRTSAMMLKGTKKDVQTIARELDVQYVLEGSVRKSGNNLRITAQLIDGLNDAHLWAEKYAGTLDDVFDIQEKVSRSIVDALRLKLSFKEDGRFAEKPITNVSAYECYLQAKREAFSFNREKLDHALRLTNQALHIVGENPLLYATLGIVYWQHYNAGVRQDEEVLIQADAAAAKAIELNPGLSQGYSAAGAIAYSRGDLPIAARQFKRAAELESGGEPLSWLSYICALAGRMPEARQYSDQALNVDPMNIWPVHSRGCIELFGGDYKSAAEWQQKALELIPDDPAALFFCAVALLYAGNREQASALFDRVVKADLGPVSSVATLGNAALRADSQTIRRIATDLQAYATRDKEFSWFFADCLALIGDTKDALSWLANSIDRGLINDRFFSEFDPFLAPLRGDQRFQSLMERARERQRTFVV